MKSKYIVNLLAYVLLLLCFSSCSRFGKEVENTLTFAGANRHELEAVLEHYQDSALKLKAAEFLIGNMLGFSVPDTAALAVYQPFYQTCDSIRMKYQPTQWWRWEELIDSLWKVYQDRNRLQQPRMIPLHKAITAKQLISEIDLAFKVWKENVFFKDCSFEHFCEYILPFFRAGSFMLNDTRHRFNQLYEGRFYCDSTKSVFAETDSLGVFYKDIRYSTFCGSNFPILTTEALIKVGGGRCPERGVFNLLLFSALGVPVAVDFVPMWGNVGNTHSWNVLITENGKYAFEPFLLKDKWYYNSVYGNVGFYDPNGHGELRAAKIYRKTYSTHFESTLLKKGIPMEDIPPLFCNFKMRDVSSEYFETADVEVNLTEAPSNDVEYAYLCVFDSEKLVPVQYGKIHNRKVIFSGMGKNIVYFPAYYKSGNIQVASAPFLLTQDGSIQVLNPKAKTNEVLIISDVWPNAYLNRNYLNCMEGTSITRCFPNKAQDTLCTILSSLPFEHTTYELNTTSPCRFVRLNLPSDSIALGDLSFYSSNGKIHGIKITTSLQSLPTNSLQDYLFDDFKSTSFRGKVKNNYVDIDLGNEYKLTSIDISPYVQSFLYANSEYELFYWKNGWKSLGKQKGGVDFLTFKKVPKNALLRLRQSTKTDKMIKDRIFLYENGEVLWK